MGLLSMFGASPETQEKFSKGLLAVEMSFPHLRRLRMEEDQATSEAEWKKRQREMQEAQYKQTQDDRARTMNDDALIQRLYGMPTEGAMPQGQAGPGMPMPNAGIDPQTFLRQGGTIGGLSKAAEVQKLFAPKPFEPIVSKPGDIARGQKGEILWQNPETPKQEVAPGIVRLMEYRDKLPPGDPRRQVIDAQIAKDTTHAPAAQAISYGSPVPVMLPDGSTGYAQPGNRAGAAPQLMTAPGGKPLVAPKKIGEKQTNQNAGIDALGGAIDEYVSKLGSWKKADALDPDKRADMGTFYNNVMLQAKEAYNLGVLNGPDLAILESVIQNPISMVGTITSNEALAKQATNLKRMMSKIKAAQGGGGVPAAPGAAASSPGAAASSPGVDELVNKYRSK